jgi:hypothetical protein
MNKDVRAVSLPDEAERFDFIDFTLPIILLPSKNTTVHSAYMRAMAWKYVRSASDVAACAGNDCRTFSAQPVLEH